MQTANVGLKYYNAMQTLYTAGPNPNLQYIKILMVLTSNPSSEKYQEHQPKKMHSSDVTAESELLGENLETGKNWGQGAAGQTYEDTRTTNLYVVLRQTVAAKLEAQCRECLRMM